MMTVKNGNSTYKGSIPHSPRCWGHTMEKASAFMAYLCDFLGASSYLLCDTECWARWALPWFKPERMEEEPFFFFFFKKKPPQILIL